jgi:hypothetical protein
MAMTDVDTPLAVVDEVSIVTFLSNNIQISTIPRDGHHVWG